jgi:hypothetical protein
LGQLRSNFHNEIIGKDGEEMHNVLSKEIGSTQLGHTSNIFDGRGANFRLVVLKETGEEFKYFILTIYVLWSDES